MSEYSKRQKLLMLNGLMEMIDTSDFQTKQQMIDLINSEKNYINGKQ